MVAPLFHAQISQEVGQELINHYVQRTTAVQGNSFRNIARSRGNMGPTLSRQSYPDSLADSCKQLVVMVTWLTSCSFGVAEGLCETLSYSTTQADLVSGGVCCDNGMSLIPWR